ncbi:MAG: radical SAM protein [Chitinophagaceae bacterium]|nr:radical SAM protein [Chitinophagaceae bacterium]
MFNLSDYAGRGYNFLHNHLFPKSKRLSSLMIYATDLCDSGCKHCLIWAKRPVTYLPLETIKKIMASHCVSSGTMVGLEGGEFLLHPQADEILKWFAENHPNYDLFSNCLRPLKLIEAVKKYKPHRLYISLDGDKETYQYMRGKDGYGSVIKVIEELKDIVPVFVMFTLSPYNDYNDLEHVAEICETYKVFLRVGIYNNIPFFDTIDDSREVMFGQLKNQHVLTYREAVELRDTKVVREKESDAEVLINKKQIPDIIKRFSENYDYVKLYQNWATGNLRLKCNSILDSVIVLPNGDVPICQYLDLKLGNIYNNTLDEIFNSEKSTATQKHYSENCNQCWVSYHRKYDIILYRNFERFFGRWATSKMLGYYKWDEDESLTYKGVVEG